LDFLDEELFEKYKNLNEYSFSDVLNEIYEKEELTFFQRFQFFRIIYYSNLLSFYHGKFWNNWIKEYHNEGKRNYNEDINKYFNENEKQNIRSIINEYDFKSLYNNALYGTKPFKGEKK